MPPRVTQLTPPGRSAIATLRIEGPGTRELVQSQIHSKTLPDDTSKPLVTRFGIENPETVVIRCCTDNAIEIHCHGGFAAIERIRNVFIQAGCEEITWQQWLASISCDSFSAAAISALTEARTERTASILLDQLAGAFKNEIATIRHLIECHNFDKARQQIKQILDRAVIGRHLTTPWRVVLAGRPNVGKSSLINALVGFDRAIVHETPGTTRDAVIVNTAIDGWPIELCDTAGLRSEADQLEQIGIELARQKMASAELVILVFDRSQPWTTEDQMLVDQWPHALLVHNKCDLLPAEGSRPAGIETSAQTNAGIELLRAEIASRLVPAPPSPAVAVPFTREQEKLLLDLLSLCSQSERQTTPH